MEFLPLIAVVLVFWLLIVRPASRRQKQLQQLQASLKPGDRVVLASGLYGTLSVVGDDRLHVEVAPGVVVEVARGAIAAVEAPAVSEFPEGPEADGPHGREG